MIGAGVEWQAEIELHLNTAQIILLLVSADFLASDFCNGVEVKRSIDRHKKGDVCVIPVILRACLWNRAPFAKLQAYPKDAKPVTSWDNIDEAFKNVAEGIERAAQDLQPRPKRPNKQPRPDTKHYIPRKGWRIGTSIIAAVATIIVGYWQYMYNNNLKASIVEKEYAGQIVDNINNPIQGAVVQIRDEEGGIQVKKTDSVGKYQYFLKSSVKTVHLTIRSEKYEDYERDLPPNQTVQEPFALKLREPYTPKDIPTRSPSHLPTISRTPPPRPSPTCPPGERARGNC